MAVQAISIEPGIDPGLLDIIRAAEPAVERVLGSATDRVDVTWGPGEEVGGEPTARLRLADNGVTRTGDFTAWDLDDEIQFSRRLRQMWDDILAERIRIKQRRVYESLGANGEE